jgi:hypothetical protein
MQYSVRVADDGSCIILKMNGRSGRPEFSGVLEAHALGMKHGIHHYLVDLTEAVNPDSVLEDYQLAHADFPSNPTIDLAAKAVALARPGDHSHDFLVTVFRNAGAFIELFHDRETAMKALLAD